MARDLLDTLRDHDHHPGSALARQTGTTRSAIWKRIETLRRRGYTIESNHRGYRLTASPEEPIPEELLPGLQARVFRRIHHHPQLASTNDTAKQKARRGAPEGTVIITTRQTRGRGRRERTWHSPPGGLYMSLLTRPPWTPPETFRLTLLTGVAAARAIEQTAGATPQLKWPNDLLLGGKKLGGILTEAETEPDTIRYAIVGIGINVHTTEFPKELRTTATSLAREGYPCRRADLARTLLQEFEAQYTGGFSLREYRRRCVTLGEQVRVETPGGTLEGTARDIGEDGALLLEADGRTQRVLSGDVVHVR